VQLITVETTLRLYWQDTRLKVTKRLDNHKKLEKRLIFLEKAKDSEML
jgi:hypothetical protein